MKWSLKFRPIPCPQCQSGLKVLSTLRSKSKNPFKANALYFQCSGCHERFVLPNKQSLEWSDMGGLSSLLAGIWGMLFLTTDEIKSWLHIDSTGIILMLIVIIATVITVVLIGFANPHIHRAKAKCAQQLLPLNAQTLKKHPELDYKDVRIRWRK